MHWNYTKTFLILPGLLVAVVAMGHEWGQPILEVLAAGIAMGVAVALLVVPIGVLADFIAWRREVRRQRAGAALRQRATRHQRSAVAPVPGSERVPTSD